MKRLFAFCLLLVFIAGCVPFGKEIPKPTDIVVRAGTELSESLKKVTGELGANEYLMTPESKVNIDGKLVTLKEMTFDYRMTFVVDGQEYLISRTNEPEIINGAEITVKKVSFDPEAKDTYAIVKIVKYTTGENEHLMYIDSSVSVGGKKVQVTMFNNDESIYVKVDTTEDRIREGETKVINELSITNIKTNLRAITSEKYSILKIEE